MDGSDKLDNDFSENSQNEDSNVTTGTAEVDRDEVKEVRKLASKDTNRIKVWRYVITVVLCMTAVAVTVSTFTLLKQQEDENFQTAVSSAGINVFFISVL